jgi:DNA mismatch repair protein MutS2
MNEETLRVLEFGKIQALLAGCTMTPPGREAALHLQPMREKTAVVTALAEVSEAAILLGKAGPAPLAGAHDLREHLRQLRAEGSWLPSEPLLQILSCCDVAVACRRYFTDAGCAPGLTALAAALIDIRELRRELRASLGPRGEILDEASFELGDIRRELRQVRTRIKKMLEEMLSSEQLASAFQDRLITERGGRYVLPVRADHRGQVRGFIHDESASGQTLFVEPTAVLEQNNQLQGLLRAEKREEERILRHLSGQVRRNSETLLDNQRLLTLLDCRSAAGRFSCRYEGIAPEISDRPMLELRGARHPLLLFQGDGQRRETSAVPIDLLLGEGHDTLVISGPNTGGKSVALKTAGLLVLMAAAGLHLPCLPGSRLHLFTGVFADIGDEQSIEENLSTFSGHLTRIGRILAAANGDSLVLLDEAGTGTDPAEGGALALAVLDTLRARGTRIVLTTHLNLVKGYAHLQPGVENAAVEFDRQTMAPSYRLHYGIPGASSAFSIARNLGIPEAVLTQAERYLGEGERSALAIIEELNRLHRQLQDELTAAHRERQQAAADREHRRKLLNDLEGQKKAVLEKAVRRAEQLVRETEQKLRTQVGDGAPATPKDRARQSEQLKEIKGELSALQPVRRAHPPQEVGVGEILRVPALGAEGEVLRQQEDKVELLLQGKRLRLPLNELEACAPRRFAPKGGGRKTVRSSVQRQQVQQRLLLVGKRTDEALLLLERFLDDALLHDLREVEIVHGSGEGVLRQVVRDYLRSHQDVTAFHAGDLAYGGENVTIAELRGA